MNAPFSWQDHATPADLADINACSGCQPKPGQIRLCKRHYRRLYYRAWYGGKLPQPARRNLSPTQLIILALLKQAPYSGLSYRHLSGQMGQPFSTIKGHINTLTAWGYLKGPKGKAKALRLTEAGERAACGLLLSRCGQRVSGVWRVVHQEEA